MKIRKIVFHSRSTLCANKLIYSFKKLELSQSIPNPPPHKKIKLYPVSLLRYH